MKWNLLPILTIMTIFFQTTLSTAQQSLMIDPVDKWIYRSYLAESEDDSLVLDGSNRSIPQLARQKSPLKAFALSAVIPGMGEIYAGKKTGLLKTALEIGLWSGFFYYNGKAEDKKDEYESYADEHWSFIRWEEWYTNTGWEEKQSETFERDANLDPVKDHHYYEKLGKYAWAQGGWDDFYNEYQVDFRIITFSEN
ncbi:MAG: hypothetical protein GY839_21085, partial [candidate division Zixibacteria bacterium]|nr:hypothetical protein [candidate division Zixibacteria bacterium]